jgi:hypothetical protein
MTGRRFPSKEGQGRSGPGGGVDLGKNPPRRGAPPLQGGDSQGNALFQMFCVFILALLASWRFAFSG